MKHWAAVAEQLVAVRQAQEEFLMRDLIESSIIGPMLLDRLAADLADARPASAGLYGQKPPMQRRRQITDEQ